MQTGLRPREMHLLPTAPLHGKASHWILRSLPLPYESSSLATPVGRSTLRLPFISYIIMNNITVISRLPRSADQKEGLLLGRLEANFD